MKLCSACLLGVKCRYNGESALNQKVIALLKAEILIPVCPEQLGGLPTPREPAELKGDRVITKSGRDVTENFVRGAKQVLELAKLFGIKKAILKQGSPSCGCGRISDEKISGGAAKGYGITAALLKENGIEVISEEDL
ncbi:MAG: DUF523 domain-containing protein [Candidatus Bathyarchaeales archaeon]